jgi:phage gp45-like
MGLIEDMINSLRNKIKTMIQRTVVTLSKPTITGEYPSYQVEALGKTTDVENISPYGLASTLPVDATGVKFNIQGESSKQVGLSYDPSKLPPLQPNGEVAVGGYSATIPTYLKFTNQGTIEVWKGGILVIVDLITHLHSGVTSGGDPSGPPIL